MQEQEEPDLREALVPGGSCLVGAGSGKLLAVAGELRMLKYGSRLVICF